MGQRGESLPSKGFLGETASLAAPGGSMRQGTGFSRVIKRGEDACRDYGLSMQQLRTFQAEYRSDFAGAYPIDESSIP